MWVPSLPSLYSPTIQSHLDSVDFWHGVVKKVWALLIQTVSWSHPWYIFTIEKLGLLHNWQNKTNFHAGSAASHSSVPWMSVNWIYILIGVKVVLGFIGGRVRAIARETAFQIALRNCSKEVGGRPSIYVISVKGKYMKSSIYFLQKFSASLLKAAAIHEEHMSPWWIFVLFQIWGDIRIRLIKSSPENILLSEGLLCKFFPEHSVPPSWSPSWTPFRRCWRSAAAMAYNLIFVEVDGKCQYLVTGVSRICPPEAPFPAVQVKVKSESVSCSVVSDSLQLHGL